MHSGTVFLVVGHQVCIHLRRGFSRLLALQILSPVDFLKAALQLEASAPPQTFMWWVGGIVQHCSYTGQHCPLQHRCWRVQLHTPKGYCP